MKRFKNVLSVIAILLLITLTASAGSQGRDAWSYAGDSGNIPIPTSANWTLAALDQKSAISYIDSNRWETKFTTGHNQTDYQMYRFNVMQPVDNITNLTATWTGYGEVQANYDTYLYIWNNNISSWELLDTKHLTTDGALSGSRTNNVSSYVDGQGFVFIAAGAKHYNYAPPAPTGLSANPQSGYVTISWSPVTDPDGDTVQYYVELFGGPNSGWINTTSTSIGGLDWNNYGYTYGVKSRDTFANAESPFTTDDVGKSSCPFLYGWNGSSYTYRTDLQGEVIGAPFFKVKDYRAGLYDMGSLRPDNGAYKMKIRETIAEADYFDEAKLWVVDVPKGYSVYTDWNDVYIPGLPVTYNLYTVKNPQKLKSAYDKFGRDILKNLKETDDHPVIETLNDTNYYTLDFGQVKHPEYAKLIVYGWNAFLKRESDIDPYKNVSSYHEQNTIIEVINKSGKWQKVKEFGRLAGDLKPTVFNISNIWLTNDHRLRIHPAYSKFSTMVLDKIELDDSEPVPIEVRKLEPRYADLHHAGSDSYIYPDLEHRLHAYDTVNNDQKPSYFYGNFTKYGDVLPLLKEADDKFVIMRHGDELKLEFPAIEEKRGSERKLFLYADVYYSIKKTVDGTILRDTVDPLPFHGMSKYPYNISVENYPYDESHLSYLKDWNTRVCEKGKDYCYDAKTGEVIDKGTLIGRNWDILDLFNITSKKEKVSKKDEGVLPHSLNTNYVELKINNQIIGDTIFNPNSTNPTSSGSFISWDNDVASDNRVYYGLNETDINNLVNGSWSLWNNNTMKVDIRLSGLAANTTYYYKPQSWYLGTVNNSVPAKTFMTLKPGVWISPAEYMVSPSGWIASPANFRTINISAAPLNNTGYYISGLSLEAVIYNSTGSEIGRTNLSGDGQYTGNFTLPDYLSDGGYVVKIPGYPIAGDFSVLKWNCVNCHVGPGVNYPSTFDAGIVHSKHFDTTAISTEHPDPFCLKCSPILYTSTYDCGECHTSQSPYWVDHPSAVGSDACTSCHISPSGTTAALACENCHNDRTTNQSVLSLPYGLDKHLNQDCSNCHGNLTSMNTKPSCTSCHPAPGSNLTSVPDSLENLTHSPEQNVACGLCHNREHDIKSVTMDSRTCRSCHLDITHDGGAQCTVCHGSDPHFITASSDTTPPTTTLTLSGALGNNNWYISDVQVNLTAIDNESGVNKTDYSFDNTTWNTSTDSFNITSEGTTTLYYYSIDNAGNVEPTKNQTIKIDKTSPVIMGNATTPPNSNGWYNTSVTIHFTASDVVSGIDTVTPDTTLTAEGVNQSVTGTATDKAGNSVNFTVYGINIDKTPPNITINTPTPYGLYTVGMMLNISSIDLLSGVANVSGVLTNTLGDSQIVYNGSQPAVGVYTLAVGATDQAGNTVASDPVFFVVYDPTGSFATGGGWFFPDSNSTSPGNKSNFGFESKYRNGTSTGDLEFQQKDANINLKSTSIDWLVVYSNVSAEFQGTGTINNTGLYTFQVLAMDNGEPGTGSDYFNISVWNGTNIGADPYYKAANVLAGGNIIIHKE